MRTGRTRLLLRTNSGEASRGRPPVSSAAELFGEFFDTQGTNAPQDFRYHGLALARIGRTREAGECWARAIEAGDTTAETYRLKAANCLALDDLEGARIYIDKALALAPDSLTSNKLSAEIFDRSRDHEQAARLYQKSLYGLAYAGRFDEAMEVLERLDTLGVRDDAQTSAVRGWTLFQLGRSDEALLALDRALGAEPGSTLAAGVKGQVLLAMNRAAERSRYSTVRWHWPRTSRGCMPSAARLWRDWVGTTTP